MWDLIVSVPDHCLSFYFPFVLNFHRECWNPVKKHSKALVFFAVSKQIPIIYSADRGRAEINAQGNSFM